MADYTKIRLNDGGWIPSVALGTGTSYFNRNDDVCEGILKAVKVGYKLIDTAVMYGTEVGVGNAMSKIKDGKICEREAMFITTKLPPGFHEVHEVSLIYILTYTKHI